MQTISRETFSSCIKTFFPPTYVWLDYSAMRKDEEEKNWEEIEQDFGTKNGPFKGHQIFLIVFTWLYV